MSKAFVQNSVCLILGLMLQMYAVVADFPLPHGSYQNSCEFCKFKEDFTLQCEKCMVVGKYNFERTKSTVLKLQYGPRDDPHDPTKSPCGDIANRGHYQGPGDTNPISELTCEGKH